MTHAISVNGLAKPKFKVYSSRIQDHGNWKGRDDSKIYNKQLTWVLSVQSKCHASDSRPSPENPVAIPEMASSNECWAQKSLRVEPSSGIALLSSNSCRDKNQKTQHCSNDNAYGKLCQEPWLVWSQKPSTQKQKGTQTSKLSQAKGPA